MEIHDRLVSGLAELSRAAQSAYGEKSGQGRILALLRETGDISQGDLRKRLGVCPSSASEILAKLVKAGFAERLTIGTRSVICLTEAGRIEGAKAAERYRKARERLFNCLTEEEERDLLSMIDRLCEHWERVRQETRRRKRCEKLVPRPFEEGDSGKGF